jgi:hypothetical protein
MVVIEASDCSKTAISYPTSSRELYGPHFGAINRRLRYIGLMRTFTPRKKIPPPRSAASGDRTPIFRNDVPTPRSNASKRPVRGFILRGLISSHAESSNAMIPVIQVFVDMDFTLTGADGRVISACAKRTPARTRTFKLQTLSREWRSRSSNEKARRKSSPRL